MGGRLSPMSRLVKYKINKYGKYRIANVRKSRMMILITRKHTFTPHFDDMKYLMDKKIYSIYLLA